MNRAATLLIALLMICSCAEKTKTATDWTCGWEIAPAAVVDTAAVKAHFNLHPDRWEAAFDFLKTTCLDSLAVGEYLIADRDVYAIVSEYLPKPAMECLFESHRTYIDLQYLIRGKEQMGVTRPEKVVVRSDYDATRDIAFFGPEAEARYVTATPTEFFVFFPQDVHRPGMRCGEEPNPVRKIVLKIRY